MATKQERIDRMNYYLIRIRQGYGNDPYMKEAFEDVEQAILDRIEYVKSLDIP